MAFAVAQLEHAFQSLFSIETPSTNLSSMTQSTPAGESAGDELWEDYYTSFDTLSKEAIRDLRSILKDVYSVGHFRECVSAYKQARKPFVNAFTRFRLEKLTTGDIQLLLWEELKTKVDLWIQAAVLCVRVIFPGEKQLIEKIFGGVGSDLHDELFVASVKDATVQLFDFAEAVSTSRHIRSPRKLFTILDLYKALLVVLPEIDVLFPSKSLESMPTRATHILSRLGEVVRGILLDFESSVVYELSPVPKAGGIIHPLTKYVMDYVSLILKYKKILAKLIVLKPPTSFGDLRVPGTEFAEAEGKTPLSLHLVLILVALRFNLEGKSKKYENAHPVGKLGLSRDREEGSFSVHFFMANNVHYIIQNIEESPKLREIVGEKYLDKLAKDLRQSVTSYQISVCCGILRCLRNDGLRETTCFSGGVSRTALRKRIKKFNAMLEEIRGTRAKREVADMKLRGMLCQSVTESLVPAYQSFLDQFGTDIESRNHPHNQYTKYSIDDLKILINKNFFAEGSTAGMPKWSR